MYVLVFVRVCVYVYKYIHAMVFLRSEENSQESILSYLFIAPKH